LSLAAPEALVRAFEPWAAIYGDSSVLPTLVVFGHIAALVFAGGLGVTLDRATLRAARGSAEDRSRQIGELGAAHRLIIGGLALSAVTGVLLFAADVETYFGAPAFWVKMTLVTSLLVNGYLMTRAERSTRAAEASAGAAAWKALRRTAIASMILWFATAFVGVALVNI
jgi:uncharacterized membrane protein